MEGIMRQNEYFTPDQVTILSVKNDLSLKINVLKKFSLAWRFRSDTGNTCSINIVTRKISTLTSSTFVTLDESWLCIIHIHSPFYL